MQVRYFTKLLALRFLGGIKYYVYGVSGLSLLLQYYRLINCSIVGNFEGSDFHQFYCWSTIHENLTHEISVPAMSALVSKKN